MTSEGIALILFVLGFGIAIISGKRWSYLTFLALLAIGVGSIGYEFSTDLHTFEHSDTLPVMIMLLGSALVLTVIGLYIRFPISIRLMMLKVLIFGIMMLVFVVPHLQRVRHSTELQKVLQRKQMKEPHFHMGRICGVVWKGPITDEEFQLIIQADPVNELAFEDTELTTSQKAWYDDWKNSRSRH